MNKGYNINEGKQLFIYLNNGEPYAMKVARTVRERLFNQLIN